MQKVNMHEAKIHLSRYVNLDAGEEEILIARAGKPVAWPSNPDSRVIATKVLGTGKGTFQDS